MYDKGCLLRCFASACGLAVLWSAVYIAGCAGCRGERPAAVVEKAAAPAEPAPPREERWEKIELDRREFTAALGERFKLVYHTRYSQEQGDRRDLPSSCIIALREKRGDKYVSIDSFPATSDGEKIYTLPAGRYHVDVRGVNTSHYIEVFREASGR
jgi:hypothetical protein